MAGIIDIPIVGPSYHLKDWAIDCQRTLNLYPQVVESGKAPQVSALLPTEGLFKRYEFSGPIRGLYALSDRVLVVAGSKLHVIKNSITSEIGGIDGTDLVTFADNSLQVMISAESSYKYAIEDGTLSKLSIDDNTGFFGASSVTFLDSRFIWTVPNSGRIQWSKLLSTDTTALSYSTAESKSDDLVRVVASNGQLWLIGTNTTEIWNSTESLDRPYVRQSGAYIPVGCAAKNSISVFGSSLIWLAQTEHGENQIMMTQGYQMQRISNHAIETEISNYPKTNDAYAFSYQQNGHGFYLISFPSAKKTWVFDATTNMWHERSFYKPANATHEHHRAQTHCFFNNEHLVGDRENGKVYSLSPKYETDDGSLIMRERTTPCLNPQATRIVFDEVQLICQVGQDRDVNPLVMFDWSDDGGRTWSNDRQESIGGIGEYEKRVIFRRLGQSFNRVFRVRMTDAARLVLLGAKARVR
ncbi:packaged DNA stabilization protein [Acinetobacter sp. Ac_5812]|uniref:packaged DNA stabilization protein n=1 Tax=Acinetobacter sp. Ac_5812 TaxID=1848937 RepID=UPI00148F959D|nr:packaged DNA stabilization protein [Acinetobacter sp. Ac_5812]NNP70933.1 hypothetical protein [Acinetobacter sp. Ac_5812]